MNDDKEVVVIRFPYDAVPDNDMDNPHIMKVTAIFLEDKENHRVVDSNISVAWDSTGFQPNEWMIPYGLDTYFIFGEVYLYCKKNSKILDLPQDILDRLQLVMFGEFRSMRVKHDEMIFNITGSTIKGDPSGE